MMPGQGPKRKPNKTGLKILFLAIILLGIVTAATVTITKTSLADFGGFFLRAYYENANAPVTGCTAPCLTVDTQTSQPGTSGSFSLSAGSDMYLWTPQFTSSASIPAGALSLQLFADLPAPVPDGSQTGTWTTGSSFTITPFSTTASNDIVVLSIETALSGSSVTVSSVSDTQTKITWQGTARNTFASCSGGSESTHIEWYGTASTAVTSDTITINLSTTPTSASGIGFGVSGADITTPFDPASGLPGTNSHCGGAANVPNVSGVSTSLDTDFIFSLFGGANSVTETAGSIGGATASLVTAAFAGTGDSNAAQYVTTTTTQSSISCSFGSNTKNWNIFCDALRPGGKSITVSCATTNSAGTVQSTMISGSSATVTVQATPISLSLSAGTIPASGYVRVIITAP